MIRFKWQNLVTESFKNENKLDGNLDVQKARISDIDALVDLRIRYLTEDHGRLEARDAGTIAEKLPEYFRTHLLRGGH